MSGLGDHSLGEGSRLNVVIGLRSVVPYNTSIYHIILRRGSRIQKGGFVQEFRLENRSYPDVHDFSLCMQVIIAND